ncbi:response regulator [Flavobacterium sp. MAH-1]|uniref:Response regulator n=1 Tax=Flavobacterium agri TaxID=2743471 RepID=A0A7Y8Y432_9FLAO|nr:response regulator [Flavobacterium agri]NUY82137.1 response regulator [Flavobacterium agri]NYA72161.1 response regulator [Flavobacterium agri]
MKTDSNFTIFYTDDDPEDLEFFREATQSIDQSVELVTLSNGKELIDILDNPPPTPHLVFLDVNMPGLTGFDVLQHVRKTESREQLPIVMFTTSNDQVIIETSLRLGANFFVQKSSSFPNLKKSIEHAIKIDWSKFKTTSDNFVYAA